MKVVLIKEVKKLGKKGDVKEVAEGYARNFLLKNNLAKLATPEAIKEVEGRKKKEKELEESNLKKFREMAVKLEKTTFVIEAKEKDGKLFGSIGAKNIKESLNNLGYQVEERWIELKEPIKTVGWHQIKINFYKNISSSIRLEVKGEK